MSATVNREPHAEAVGLAEPLRSRWSPSVFDADHTLSTDAITLLLRAAQWSPSWGNSQPWGFVVAPRGSAAHVAVVPTLTQGNRGWVPRAALVLLAGTTVEADPGAGADTKAPNPDYARYDLGQAAAHVTVQAGAMGLSVHQFAGFDKDAAAAALGVPAHVRLLAGLAVGRPGGPEGVPESELARDRRDRARRALSSMAFGERWGEPWPGLATPRDGADLSESTS